MTYANRVDDLDLWWHLKNGQFIYETHSIPKKDYFSYTTETPEGISKIGKDEVAMTELPYEKNNWFWSINLKNSWFSQLIFYLVYLLGGFAGVGILKSTIFVLTYLILFLTMLRRGASYLISFFILCLIASIGIDFNYSRPQIFSFLLFTCTLYTLYDFRKGGRSMYFLPLFMLFWSNLHGGFILGVFIIFTFAFAELLKYLLKNKFGISKISTLNKGHIKKLMIFSFISIIASLINPNGYKTFLFLLIHKQSLFATIEEYLRPMFYEYHTYWFMLILVIISILILIKNKNLDLTELFLSVILILPSLKGIRYIIFFALGTGVFLAYAITYISTKVRELKLFKKLLDMTVFSKIDLKGYVSLLLAAASLIILIKTSISGEVLKFDTGEKRYPSGAVAFIQQAKISGNMFNLYNWGGYLIWHLSPYRVFIDGRNLNETAFFHYGQILKAARGTDSAMPLWKRLLDAYNINFILTSAVSSRGNIIPLVDVLYQDRDWELIYADGKFIIFLRAISDNQDIIQQYKISKEKIYDEIINECEQGVADTPATWGYYETLGYVYMKENRFNEALTMFQKYLSMNPNNRNVKYYHDLLKQYLKQYNKYTG
jgi:tetratricopeptide (TPR) repeat protein